MSKITEEISNLELEAKDAIHLRNLYDSLIELAQDKDPNGTLAEIDFSGCDERGGRSLRFDEIYFNAYIQSEGIWRNLSFTQRTHKILKSTVIDFLNDHTHQILSIAAKQLETDIRNDYNEISSAVGKISPDLESIVKTSPKEGDSK